MLLVLGVLQFLHEQGQKKQPRHKAYSLNCTKTKLTHVIIQWGLKNIRSSGKKESVQFKIYYHKHKKRMGYFRGRNKEIVLYFNNHQHILDIVDTTLHEVVHFKQYLANPRNFEKDYEKLLASIGYDQHPMEIDARTMAAQYRDQCLSYLVAHQWVALH